MRGKISFSTYFGNLANPLLVVKGKNYGIVKYDSKAAAILGEVGERGFFEKFSLFWAFIISWLQVLSKKNLRI